MFKLGWKCVNLKKKKKSYLIILWQHSQQKTSVTNTPVLSICLITMLKESYATNYHVEQVFRTSMTKIHCDKYQPCNKAPQQYCISTDAFQPLWCYTSLSKAVGSWGWMPVCQQAAGVKVWWDIIWSSWGLKNDTLLLGGRFYAFPSQWAQHRHSSNRHVEAVTAGCRA